MAAVLQVVLFGVIPVVVLAHVTLYVQNAGGPENLEVSLLWVSGIRVSLGSALLNAWLYGLLCCAVLFYIRQLALQKDYKQLKTQFDDMKSDRDFIDRKYKRLIAAANQVLVPYRLDALVDKGIEDFAAAAYKPGLLQADIRNGVKL